jgi:cytidylate kinase
MKSHDSITELLASIQAGLYAQQRRAQEEAARQPPQPFVTISRQAGAGGRTLAKALAERLTETDPADRPWAAWDGELVDKVAAEQRIPSSLIDSLDREGPRRTMFQEFLESLLTYKPQADLDEFQVYRIVARTVRALARAGRSVIVGRGGVYATADLRGGVHLRLVSPLQDRVRHMAELLKVAERQAAKEVERIDRHREEFHRRYWKDKALLPEIFTLTLNTAAMSERQMVECVLPLVPRSPPRAPHGADVATSAAMAP